MPFREYLRLLWKPILLLFSLNIFYSFLFGSFVMGEKNPIKATLGTLIAGSLFYPIIIIFGSGIDVNLYYILPFFFLTISIIIWTGKMIAEKTGREEKAMVGGMMTIFLATSLIRILSPFVIPSYIFSTSTITLSIILQWINIVSMNVIIDIIMGMVFGAIGGLLGKKELMKTA